MKSTTITLSLTSCLLLASCTPGTYNIGKGTYYPTPKNETVQPWQMTTVHPRSHAMVPSPKQPIANKPPAHLSTQPKPPTTKQPQSPKPNDRVIVSPS